MQNKRTDRYKKLKSNAQRAMQPVADGPASDLDLAQIEAEKKAQKEARRATVVGRLWMVVLILAIGCLAVIAVSAARSVQDVPRPTLSLEPTTAPTAVAMPGQAVPTNTPKPSPTPKVMIPEMAELRAQNGDLVAWIKIDGTVIDYPVMYTPQDGQFYLYRTFEMEEDPTQQGCIFIDEHCSVDPRGTNLLLHGHNMKRGTMFHSLVEYEDPDYWREHPTIQFTTLYDQEVYEIVYAFRSRVYNQDDDVFKYYKFYQADNEEEFQAFVDGCKELALYDTGIEPQFGDEFLTLNTCEYTQENGRMVIVARKITEENRNPQTAAPESVGDAIVEAEEAQPATVDEPGWSDGVSIGGTLSA